MKLIVAIEIVIVIMMVGGEVLCREGREESDERMMRDGEKGTMREDMMIMEVVMLKMMVMLMLMIVLKTKLIMLLLILMLVMLVMMLMVLMMLLMGWRE